MRRSAPFKIQRLFALAVAIGSLFVVTAAQAAPTRIVNHPAGLGTGLAVDGDTVYWSSASGGLSKTTLGSGTTEPILARGQVTRIVARSGFLAYVVKQSNPDRRRNVYRLYRSDDGGKNIHQVAEATERDFSRLGVGRICGDLIALKSISEFGRLLYVVQSDKTRSRYCGGKHSYVSRIFAQDAGPDPTIPLKPAARFRTGRLVLAVSWPWVIEVMAPDSKSLRFTNLSTGVSTAAPIRMTAARYNSAMSSSFDQIGNAVVTVAAIGTKNPALRDAYAYPLVDATGNGRSHGDPTKLASKSPKRFISCGGSLVSWTDEFGASGKHSLEVVRNPFNPLGQPARPILPNTSRRIRQVACDSGMVVFQLAGTTAISKATDIYVNAV